MATLGSFDYPDELLQDCNMSAIDARHAADLIERYMDSATTPQRDLLQRAAHVLRYLAADTNEAMAEEYADSTETEE